MDLMSRLLSGFFVCAALSLALISFSVDWLMELYAPTDQFGNRISLLENQQKSEELSRAVALTYQRIRAKERVIAALLREEITLSTAAAEFRSLHEAHRVWNNPHRPEPAHDDGANWCREVIEWSTAKVNAEHSACQAEILRQHLEAELQEQLDYFGAVTLPE